jgi:hypothetical protein
MYIKTICQIKEKIEIEKRYDGRRGAPGQSRDKRRKKTPEEMRKQNQWRKEREVRRLIELNYEGDDFHVILTCTKENRPENNEQAKKIIRKFRDDLKNDYKKHGWICKYIITEEVGVRGAIHWHMIINNMHSDITTTEKLIRKHWKMGRPHVTPLDDSGDYKKLAEYILKQSGDQEEGDTRKTSYMCSRNLIRPVVRKEKKEARSWRKDPKAPKGWYVVANTLINGLDKFTGLPYQHYTIKRKPGGREDGSQPVHKDKHKKPKDP